MAESLAGLLLMGGIITVFSSYFWLAGGDKSRKGGEETLFFSFHRNCIPLSSFATPIFIETPPSQFTLHSGTLTLVQYPREGFSPSQGLFLVVENCPWLFVSADMAPPLTNNSENLSRDRTSAVSIPILIFSTLILECNISCRCEQWNSLSAVASYFQSLEQSDQKGSSKQA
jgi:hypothetical protein